MLTLAIHTFAHSRLILLTWVYGESSTWSVQPHQFVSRNDIGSILSQSNSGSGQYGSAKCTDGTMENEGVAVLVTTERSVADSIVVIYFYSI